MPFDGFVMSAIAGELEQTILQAKILKIYQPERNMIILRLKRGSESCQLLISANPVTGRIHLTDQSKENPMQPPLFCMVLRKHLEGGRISGFKQRPLERVLEISVQGYDEIGIPAEKILVVEIMGKHSNIILVDPKNNIVLDGIKRYSHFVSRHREILPGRPYLAPPVQDKCDPRTIDEESFRNLIYTLSLTTKISKGIIKIFLGFSPLLANELLFRAQLDADTMVDDLGEYEIIRLWQALQELMTPVRENAYQPTIYYAAGMPIDFSALPLRQFGPEAEEYPGISQALDMFFTKKEQQEHFLSRQRELLKVVTGESDRVEKKLSLQQEKYLETAEMDQYRIAGELITANFYRLSKGMEKVQLDDFYHPGETFAVTLNPMLTPAENSQYFFNKYQKAKSSKLLIEEQMQKNQEELDYLVSVTASLEQAADIPTLDEIREELVDSGYLKEKSRGKAKKEKSSLSQPISFVSSDGFTILVGKNNRQNDYLTTKLAHKDDLWFHTKNIPGSHVIIRQISGRDIPLSTLQEAASLAAYYSKARQSSQVPVDYTTVKNVKKPNGARPGMVIYFEQKTLYVVPHTGTGPLSPE